MSIEVKESSIPYADVYLFAIYNKTKGQWHKGGERFFKGTDHIQNAKMYKSDTKTEQIVNKLWEYDDDEYYIITTISKPTEARKIEKEEN